jgi:pimeloyl-ACP methyl ester carboxylesterase
MLSVGTGPPLVMLHGVSLAAAAWAPWLADLAGYRALLVELPGHGLSGPVAYRPGAVRGHALDLIDDLFDAFGLATAPVIGPHWAGRSRSGTRLPAGTDRVTGRHRRTRGRAPGAVGCRCRPDRAGA